CESGKIERSFCKIDTEEREQHRHAAEERVNKKFCRSAIPIFAAPYFNQQKCWDQAHLVEQEPKDEILRGERAVERRLHHQHGRIERATTACNWRRQKCKRNNYSGGNQANHT